MLSSKRSTLARPPHLGSVSSVDPDVPPTPSLDPTPREPDLVSVPAVLSSPQVAADSGCPGERVEWAATCSGQGRDAQLRSKKPIKTRCAGAGAGARAGAGGFCFCFQVQLAVRIRRIVRRKSWRERRNGSFLIAQVKVTRNSQTSR